MRCSGARHACCCLAGGQRASRRHMHGQGGGSPTSGRRAVESATRQKKRAMGRTDQDLQPSQSTWTRPYMLAMRPGDGD
jgi:hypothetical protein